jgi:hypothetical protein
LETLTRLEYFCINNEAEHEAILLGMQILSSMGVKHVEAFNDSLLVVQKVVNIYQCFDDSLNSYLDKYLEIIALLDDFTVHHISRDENTVVNDLTQQIPGFWSNRGKLYVLDKSDVTVSQTGWSSFQSMQGVEIYSAESSSAKSDGSISETGGSGISRSSDDLGETTMGKADDWRPPLIRYLESHGHIIDRKVWWEALKYIMLDNSLYCRTIYGLLLKYLGSNESRIDTREVYEGIYGTHQSAHKIKWLLHCASFYWSTMLNDCFRYYKGCES